MEISSPGICSKAKASRHFFTEPTALMASSLCHDVVGNDDVLYYLMELLGMASETSFLLEAR